MNITVNNKEYPLSWGMGAIEIYCDKMDCDIDGLSMVDAAETTVLRQKAIVTLILSAMQNGCELREVPCTVTYRQLQSALDEMPQDDFQAIMNDFTQSKYLGKTIAEHLLGDILPNDTDDKKKESASVES